MTKQEAIEKAQVDIESLAFIEDNGELRRRIAVLYDSALEEAAKVADEYKEPGYALNIVKHMVACEIAEDIRQLKEKP